MAVSFPLSLSDYFCGVGSIATVMTLSEAVNADEAADGSAIRVGYGDRLWRGRVTIRANSYANAGRAIALTEYLLNAEGSFYVREKRKGTYADALGVGMTGATPTIAAVNANNRDVTISGLPAGYVLAADDRIAWDYSGRRAYHRLVADVVADGAGVAVVTLDPFVKAGAVGQTPILVDAACLATVVAGSYQSPTRTTMVGGFSFEWMQKTK